MHVTFFLNHTVLFVPGVHAARASVGTSQVQDKIGDIGELSFGAVGNDLMQSQSSAHNEYQANLAFDGGNTSSLSFSQLLISFFRVGSSKPHGWFNEPHVSNVTLTPRQLLSSTAAVRRHLNSVPSIMQTTANYRTVQ